MRSLRYLSNARRKILWSSKLLGKQCVWEKSRVCGENLMLGWMPSMTRLRTRRRDSGRRSTTGLRSSTQILRRCSISGKRRSLRRGTSSLGKKLWKLLKWWRNWEHNGCHSRIGSQRSTEIVSISKRINLLSPITTSWRKSWLTRRKLGDSSMSSTKSSMNSGRKNGSPLGRRDSSHSKTFSCNGLKSSKTKIRMLWWGSSCRKLKITSKPGHWLSFVWVSHLRESTGGGSLPCSKCLRMSHLTTWSSSIWLIQYLLWLKTGSRLRNWVIRLKVKWPSEKLLGNSEYGARVPSSLWLITIQTTGELLWLRNGKRWWHRWVTTSHCLWVWRNQGFSLDLQIKSNNLRKNLEVLMTTYLNWTSFRGNGSILNLYLWEELFLRSREGSGESMRSTEASWWE